MHRDEVYRQLAEVYDPELDQPLTELGFIADVQIDDAKVVVQFRLPTYWCAGNFAFMMAADIRERVSELPWVKQVEVRLQDHFLDREINEGINGGRTFMATFPDEASDNLECLRETFRVKAFHGRQERVIRWLVRTGWEEAAILKFCVGDLRNVAAEAGETPLVDRYLAIRGERGLDNDSAAVAFCHPDGKPVELTEIRSYLRKASSTRLSMEFNASFCRGLLKTRYGDPDESDSNPTPGKDGTSGRRRV